MWNLVRTVFRAGRDIRGAFATGRGATATSIEIETLVVNTPGSATLPMPAGPIAYNLPSLPPHYQTREADVASARAKLLSAESAVGITGTRVSVGFHGMGGIGKTILATALVNDQKIKAAFTDGIAWLTFGRNAPALAKAAELAEELTGMPSSFATASGARGRLGAITLKKNMLFVLDDVWEPDAIDSFTGLGEHCRLLITTRDGSVITRLGAERHELDLLDSRAARALLAETAGVSLDELPGEADDIVRECGRLPLALSAAGALLRHGTYTWAEALDSLREAALGELDTSWLPDPEQRSVAVVLTLSVLALPTDLQACFFDCAAFKEDVEIPETALLLLWSDRVSQGRLAKRVAQQLVDRSLMRRGVTRDGQPHYRIHDLYMDYLHHAAAPLSVRHQYVLERYRSKFSSLCPDRRDTYFSQYLTWHLHEAGEIQTLHSLLFDPSWLKRRLAFVGVSTLISDCNLLSSDRDVAKLAAALGLSAHLVGIAPELLPVQLCGRLDYDDGPMISKLLITIRAVERSLLIPAWNGYLARPGARLRIIPASGVSAVLPGGRLALAASGDSSLRLWDIESGAEVRRFNGHESTVVSIAVVANGHQALSGSRDKTVRLWDINSGTEIRKFRDFGVVLGVTVLPDCFRVVSHSEDGVLRIWDLNTGTEIRRFGRSRSWVWSVAHLSCGRLGLLASDQRTLRLWDLDGDTVVQTFEIGVDSYDYEYGAVAQETAGGGESVLSLATYPSHRRALSGLKDGTLRLWDMESGVPLRSHKAHDAQIWSVSFLPDGRRALSGSEDGTVRLWDLANWAELRRFEGHTGPVRSIEVLPGGRHVLSTSDDGTLGLWDLESEAEAQRSEKRTAIVLLPDGRHVLSSAGDSMLRLWDLDARTEVRWFACPDQIDALAVTSDGRSALTSSGSTCRLWDLASGNEVRQFKQRGKVSALAVVPGGRLILSSLDSGSVYLWDLENETEIHEFVHDLKATEKTILSGRSYGLLLSLSDRRSVLLLSDDRTFRLWDLDRGCEISSLPTERGRLLELQDLEVAAKRERDFGSSISSLVSLFQSYPADFGMLRADQRRQRTQHVDSSREA